MAVVKNEFSKANDEGEQVEVLENTEQIWKNGDEIHLDYFKKLGIYKKNAFFPRQIPEDEQKIIKTEQFFDKTKSNEISFKIDKTFVEEDKNQLIEKKCPKASIPSNE